MYMKDEKPCKGCKQTLPRSAFYTKGHSKVNGRPYLSTLCIACTLLKGKTEDKDRNQQYRETWIENGGRAKLNAYMRGWHKSHPSRHVHEKIAYYEYNSHSGRGRIKRPVWEARILAFGNQCVYCGLQTERLEVDHFIPAVLGGVNEITNFVPACRSCNAAKGDTHPSHFLNPFEYNQIVLILESLMT